MNLKLNVVDVVRFDLTDMGKLFAMGNIALF